jgi:hypothetical protein
MTLRARVAALLVVSTFGLGAPAVRALTLEFPQFAGNAGGAEITTFATLHEIVFSDDVDAPFDSYASLFGGVVLASDAVGVAHFADASAGEDFAKAVGSLTDGGPGWVGIAFVPADPNQPFIPYALDAEPSLPGQVDLAGLEIVRIGFRLDAFSVASPGSDPNGDGIWTDLAYTATLIVETPEPAPLALLAAALGALALRPRRARTA